MGNKFTEMTREAGKKILAERIDDFEKNKAILTMKGHGETNIRANYIDVLFQALGWNMTNVYEVDREYSQKNNSSTKKVDYGFKINGKLKFFVEAKEANVDLENNKNAIYQAKRYAYSTNGKAPVVILTDFEEFLVFSVLKAPLYDNTDRELLKKHSMKYSGYLANWDLLWDTFSREAVKNGSLEVLRGKIDKNTKMMDVEFLEQITGWREDLARNIAIRNKELSVEELNEAVQRILDRLLFIRNLEDREIEPENTLLDITKKPENIYKSIVPIFNYLDNVYNGLLFKKHFSEELIVDDKTIKDIIKSMCYPVSPFQFDVIEPEILGRIYEKFLGSKIRLTENHQAKIEEKIEVRKAGGVYYTPEYIVNYIVQNTVGKKIEGLTPEEIKKIKIVDPACGSGSFLLGAYSCLLDYHAKWYLSHKTDKAYKNDYYISKDGEFKVNLYKRGDILRNNIFGVDIDKEATEVAIMSLYLKMLDDGFDKGERDLFFIKGHVLPDMINNVKCGNSLIGSDYYDGRFVFNTDEMKEIKFFDWKTEFPEIFKNDGFDCVIGNPPWGANFTELELSYLRNKNSDIIVRMIDSFMYFINLSFSLFNQSGMFGMILPDVILYQNDSVKLREKILNNSHLSVIINIGDVFEKVTRPSSIIIFSINKNTTDEVFVYDASSQDKDDKPHLINDWHNFTKISQSSFSENNGLLFITSFPERYKLMQKILCIPNKPLIDFVDEDGIQRGVSPDLKKAFLVDSQTIKKYNLERTYIRRVITGGKQVKRYYIEEIDLYIIYTDRKTNFKQIPNICNYISQFKEEITCEEVKEKKHSIYSLHRARNESIFIKPSKFIGVITEDEIIVALDKTKIFATDGLYLFSLKENIDERYILGILNSKLFIFLYRLLSSEKGRTLAQVKPTIISKMPIRLIGSKNEEIDAHNNICNLVTQIIASKLESLSSRSDEDKENDKKNLKLLNTKIDKLVYYLYGLTDDEIKIVEDA